jgi:hypothetical protein
MKTKLIGLGQCGSFVVYDVIANVFDQEESSKKIKATPKSQWRRHFNKAMSQMRSRSASITIALKKYFVGLKTPDIPQFFVVDGNSKNAVVDGLLGEEINKKLGPLQVLVAALSLADRNNGCNLGQVGEYAFRKEKELGASSKVFTRLKAGEQIEINALVFAGGGGSGSGGAPVLNEELRNKDSLLFNMLVMPPHHISDLRQRWNTGRCIMRLATVHKQTALLLFSNLSESLNDQYYVNRYISKLIVRLANFGYTGNVPKVATDIDRKDLQAFFSGMPAFVGMSSMKNDIHEPNETDIEGMVDQALSLRKKQDTEEHDIKEEDIFGLSIEVPEVLEQMVLRQIRTVMIVIGLTPKYEGKVNIVDIVKRRVAKRLGTDLGNLDCRAYSYTSPNEIELTVFLRHSDYRSSFHLDYFLNSYLKWRKSEESESIYLMQKVTKGADNSFLKEVRMALDEDADENFKEWLTEKFKYPIAQDLEPVDPLERTKKVASTSQGD